MPATATATDPSQSGNSSQDNNSQEEGYKLRDTRRRLNRRRTTESSSESDEVPSGIGGLLSDFSFLNFVNSSITEPLNRHILNLPPSGRSQANRNRFMPRSQSEIEPRRQQGNKPQKRRLQKFNSEIMQSSSNNSGDQLDAKRMNLQNVTDD